MILYESTEKEFKNLGFGILTEAYSASVSETLNDSYELTFDYPVDGLLFPYITFNRIVYCKPSPYRDPQAFRIYSITTNINKTITVNACHISYDLSNYIVEPYSADSIEDAIQGLIDNTVGDSPFSYYIDITEEGSINVDAPKSIRSLLGNNISIAYEPEYEFDNFTVKLFQNRGSDLGVTVTYGINLTDLQQDENNSNIYTHVYPYYKSTGVEGEEDVFITLDQKIVSTGVELPYKKIYLYDMSSSYQSPPTKEKMLEKTEKFIERNNLGVPEISINASFIELEGSEELKLLSKVDIGDVITVDFVEAGILTKARCTSITYDVLKNSYTSITLGDASKNLSSTIVSDVKSIKNEIETKVSNASDLVNKELASAINDITGVTGGNIKLVPSKKPKTLYITDKETLQDSSVVWRFNNGGLSVSVSGQNGPWTDILKNGKILINSSTTNNISYDSLKNGILQSVNGLISIDMDSETYNLANKLVYDGGKLNLIANNISNVDNSGKTMSVIRSDSNGTIYSNSKDSKYIGIGSVNDSGTTDLKLYYAKEAFDDNLKDSLNSKSDLDMHGKTIKNAVIENGKTMSIDVNGTTLKFQNGILVE